jgi:diguanylate cyclase (GGDEF)-like protein
LFGVLRRIVFWSVAMILLISGVSFAVVSFVSLRLQHEENMTLIARTTAYATEAAVMFEDRETTTEILQEIVGREPLCSITIRTASGSEFAQAHSKNCQDSSTSHIAAFMAALSFIDDTASVNIESSGQSRPDDQRKLSQQYLGVVELRGDGSVFVGFIYRVLIVFAVCLCLAVLASRMSARFMEQRFAAELSALAGMARAARLEGNFSRRLPAFEIAEFNSLGQDFNALFGEIQARNAELSLRQSQLETVNQSLSRMAMCDMLTSLANRACFSEQLEKAISKARSANTRVGVLYIDNDHFKDINDNYGHAAGDALLVNVGRRLSGSVRESDLAARLGGDEFAILLTSVGGEDDLHHVANKILAAMARKLRLGEQEVDIELSVSIGMALFPDQADDGESLLRAADHAMYRAKRLGRARACMYDPTVDATLEET